MACKVVNRLFSFGLENGSPINFIQVYILQTINYILVIILLWYIILSENSMHAKVRKVFIFKQYYANM